MSQFRRGQKIVCVMDVDLYANQPRASKWDYQYLTKGEVYTVRRLGRFCLDNEPVVELEEVGAKDSDGSRMSFYTWRFRPVQTTDISKLVRIARDVTEGKAVKIRERA